MILGFAAVLLHLSGKRKSAWATLGAWFVVNSAAFWAMREQAKMKREQEETLSDLEKALLN